MLAEDNRAMQAARHVLEGVRATPSWCPQRKRFLSGSVSLSYTSSSLFEMF